MFRLLSRCWLPLVLLLLLFACKEEPVEPVLYGSVEGLVLSADNNAPLANAIVTTNPATSSYATDDAGKFFIRDIPVGKYTISVKRSGLKAETVSVTVNADETVPVTLALEKALTNQAPQPPVYFEPADKATGLPTTVTLRWRATDADKGDTLRYDVLLYESNSTEQRILATGIRDTFLVANNLKYNTVYFWQIIARDLEGATSRGPVWSFQTASFPVNRFVFARSVGGNTDVYSSNPDGSTLQRLTSSAFTEHAPRLSPLRDRIAYTSNETGQYQLYTMNRDGSDKRRITLLSVEGYFNQGIGYCWSPDGAYLLYSHYNELYRINNDGSGLTLLATAPAGRHFRECDWTLHDNQLVVQTMGARPYDAELYLYRADGTAPQLLVKNEKGRTDSPSFNIEGTEVLYSHDAAGYEDASGRQLNARLYRINLETNAVLEVSGNKTAGTNDLVPRYSPDGARLIFVNTFNDDQTPPRVFQADLDGRNRTQLFDNANRPDWK